MYANQCSEIESDGFPRDASTKDCKRKEQDALNPRGCLTLRLNPVETRWDFVGFWSPTLTGARKTVLKEGAELGY